MDARAKQRVRITALLGLAGVAAALRLFQLGKQSLWVDEAYTAYLARLTPLGYIDNVRHSVRNILPPLYFALLHYWTGLVGWSEVTLRLPSVVAGVLIVPLLYALMARLFDPMTGLLAAGSVAVSLFHVSYSQEARMYELLTLLSLGSLYLLVRLLDDGRPRQAAALAVVDALVVYTHHYGALLLVAEACYVGIRLLVRDLDGRVALRWLGSRVIFGVLALPWGLFLADQLSKVNAYPWRVPPTVRSVGDVLAAFAGSAAALAVFGSLLALGLLPRRGLPRRLWSRHGLTRDDRGYLLMWLVASVPPLVSIGYSLVIAPVFGEKYLIASSVAFLVLAVLGARVLPGRSWPVAALVLAVAAAGPQYLHHYRDVTKEQWREAAAYVEKNALPGDLVLFNAGYGLRDGYGFYAWRTDLDTRAFPLGSDEFATVPTPTDLAGLTHLVAGHPQAWIIYAQSRDFGATIAVELGRLSTGGVCRTFVGVTACRYVMPHAPSG